MIYILTVYRAYFTESIQLPMKMLLARINLRSEVHLHLDRFQNPIATA